MSLRSIVPVIVPSVVHSSVPCAPSLAVKTNLPLTTDARGGRADEDDGITGAIKGSCALPGLMSASCWVPKEVPSVIQSSVPACAVVPLKISFEPHGRVKLPLVGMLGDLGAMPVVSMSLSSV